MGNKTSPRDAAALRIRKMTYAAMFLSIAMVLPLIILQIPEIGKMLSPMHIPVLLCGFMCGWPWGLAVGLIAPPLRSVIFGMPAMFPEAVAMAFELAAYGAVSGLLYRMLPRRKWAVYASLLAAMIIGRLVWGLVRLFLAGVSGSAFTAAMFLGGAVTGAMPGIIMHIVLIPVLVMLMEREGLVLGRPAPESGKERRKAAEEKN